MSYASRTSDISSNADDPGSSPVSSCKRVYPAVMPAVSRQLYPELQLYAAVPRSPRSAQRAVFSFLGLSYHYHIFRMSESTSEVATAISIGSRISEIGPTATVSRKSSRERPLEGIIHGLIRGPSTNCELLRTTTRK